MTPTNGDPPSPLPGKRILVVGITGSGKTTLAKQIAALQNMPYIELDAVHWQPNWVMLDTPAFREKVVQLTAPESWVADGNYSKVRDVLWMRATTLIWLDYPFLVSFSQLFIRSVRRLIQREVLWNGNVETWKGMFLSKDSLFLWALQSYPRMKKQYPELLARPENAHLQLIRLRSRAETQRFLRSLGMQETT